MFDFEKDISMEEFMKIDRFKQSSKSISTHTDEKQEDTGKVGQKLSKWGELKFDSLKNQAEGLQQNEIENISALTIKADKATKQDKTKEYMEVLAYVKYNYFQDTYRMFVSKTDNHTGQMSLLNHIEKLRIRALKKKINLKYIFLPSSSIASIQQDIYVQTGFPTLFKSETLNEDSIIYNGLYICNYTYILDLIEKVEQVYLQYPATKIGVIEFTSSQSHQ